MHRTYSMRQSRAPTQSQIEKPPPPPSSTKVGRLFGGGNFGHNLRKSMAGAYGPELSKKLSQLVKMEKNLMRSMELVGRERREVARQLSIWGEECDEDVSDITDKLGVLTFEIGELEDLFIDRYDQYRVTIKSIRNIEASVQPSRDRKQKITDQIAQLKYKDPNSPKIVVLEQELVRAEAESLVAEAQLSNITREKIKSAFTYQFDALREHSEKLALIAGYGKHLLELIDDTPVTPGETREAYDGYEASKGIIQDCEDALTNWVESKAAVKPRLSVRGSRQRRTHGRGTRSSGSAGEPVSLTDQDRPMRGSGVWVPADEHERHRTQGAPALDRADDDDQYEDITDDEVDRRHRRGSQRHEHDHEHGHDADRRQSSRSRDSKNIDGTNGDAHSHGREEEGGATLQDCQTSTGGVGKETTFGDMDTVTTATTQPAAFPTGYNNGIHNTTSSILMPGSSPPGTYPTEPTTSTTTTPGDYQNCKPTASTTAPTISNPLVLRSPQPLLATPPTPPKKNSQRKNREDQLAMRTTMRDDPQYQEQKEDSSRVLRAECESGTCGLLLMNSTMDGVGGYCGREGREHESFRQGKREGLLGLRLH